MSKKPKTIQDFLCLGLTVQGFDEILPSPTRRARCFQHGDKRDARYFIGRAGSLRIGRGYSDSLAASKAIINSLLNDGHEQAAKMAEVERKHKHINLDNLGF